jgi:hypothetical protein
MVVGTGTTGWSTTLLRCPRARACPLLVVLLRPGVLVPRRRSLVSPGCLVFDLRRIRLVVRIGGWYRAASPVKMRLRSQWLGLGRIDVYPALGFRLNGRCNRGLAGRCRLVPRCHDGGARLRVAAKGRTNNERQTEHQSGGKGQRDPHLRGKRRRPNAGDWSAGQPDPFPLFGRIVRVEAASALESIRCRHQFLVSLSRASSWALTLST